MSCCGQKRSALKQSPVASKAAPKGAPSRPAPVASQALSSAAVRAYRARNAAGRAR
jgi:hypothetical protein